MIWEGPRATTAYPGPRGTIEVVFNTSAGLTLNTSAGCPRALAASPLGRMYLLATSFNITLINIITAVNISDSSQRRISAIVSKALSGIYTNDAWSRSCNGAGFELNVGGKTTLVAAAVIKPGEPNVIVLTPAAGQNMSTIGDGHTQNSVRYALADWPVCSVRNAKSSGGSTTMPLPARIFDLSICGGDRCPGIMCRHSRCPPQPLPPHKADDELATTMAAVGSVLAARAMVAPPPPPPPENFIPADSPSCWYTGRTQINKDGSRSFDWEGTQLWLNVQGASYIKMVCIASLLVTLIPLGSIR